jgi:hypothetical protein
MTLKQDCELWATFDSEDVDPSRGIVRDRSGKGRTLEASGGPTYGQASPVGEAVGFDGTDDSFDVPSNLENGQEFTVFVLLRTDSITKRQRIIGNTSADGVRMQISGSGNLKVGVFDADGILFTGFMPIIDGYQALLGRYNGSRLEGRNLTTGKFSGKTVSSRVGGTNDVRIGNLFGGFFLDGNIATVGWWSRALSDAEIEQLNRMTDRMVSKL